jgi:hypothetical protein
MCRMTSGYRDTHPLRHYVAKQLNLSDVPDEFWNKGVTHHLVRFWEQAVSTAEKAARQDRVVDSIREDMKAATSLGADLTPWIIPQRKGRAPVEANLSPDDSIALRAEALCIYWTKLAEGEPRLRKFREDILGEETATLSEDRARDFLHSPAAAVWGLKFFRRKKIPIVGHTAEYLHYEGSRLFENPTWAQATVKVTWPGGETVANRRWKGWQEIRTFWDGKELVSIAPWPDSLLQRLYKVATELCRHYPWEAQDAVWLILTGKAPWVPPLTAHVRGPDLVRNHGTITITAAHWVPKDAVGKFYAEQLKSRVDSAPTPSVRRLTLFRFVVERSRGVNRWESSDPGGPKDVHVQGLDTPTWRSLQSQWNEQYPSGHKWHYRDHRNLRRDFADTSKALLGY